MVLRDYNVEYDVMGYTPIVYNENLLLISFERDESANSGEAITIFNTETNEKTHKISWDKGLGSAIVEDGKIFVFGSSNCSKLNNYIYKAELNLNGRPSIINEEKVYCAGLYQRIFNTSTSKIKDGFILAFEVDKKRKRFFK